MIQINPGEQYPIVRVLTDPSDSSTNYVRAVVRKSSDNSLITTINLTDKGSRVFIGTWDSPNPGYPLYVYIQTNVYTDSGYTTLNENYATESQQLLIDQRWQMAFGGGGGSVDYKKIKKMIDDALVDFAGKLPPAQVTVKAPQMNLTPIVKEILNGIPGVIPVQKPVELAPLARQIKELLNELRARPQFEKTDLAPLADGIASATKEIMGQIESINERLRVTMPQIEDMVVEMLATAIREKIEKLGLNLNLNVASRREEASAPVMPEKSKYANLFVKK